MTDHKFHCLMYVMNVPPTSYLEIQLCHMFSAFWIMFQNPCMKVSKRFYSHTADEHNTTDYTTFSSTQLFKPVSILQGLRVSAENHHIIRTHVTKTSKIFKRSAYINKIQRDGTVRRCLFTAKLLYMLRVSIAPIIRGISNCNCSFWYRSYHVSERRYLIRPRWRKVVALTRDMTCTRSCSYSLMYSWWWVR